MLLPTSPDQTPQGRNALPDRQRQPGTLHQEQRRAGLKTMKKKRQGASFRYTRHVPAAGEAWPLPEQPPQSLVAAQISSALMGQAHSSQYHDGVCSFCSERGWQVDHLQLRRLAFFLLAVALLVPIMLVYYMDDLPDLFSWLGVSRPEQEVSSGGKVTLSKRLAYKVDVWFSTNSWVKSAALLVATLIL